jgi:DNA-binding transcriptional ArsR family regulator
MNEQPAAFISTMIETELTEVLHALGDPIRLAIARELGLLDSILRGG